MVSPLSSMMRFFPKKFFMRFFGGNFWGGVVVHGVVTIKPSQDRQSFINAFCNKLNIANRFTDCVRISALTRTMEGFILGLSIKKKVSKVASSSLSLMLTLIWGTRVFQMQSTGGEGGNLGKMVKTVGGHGGTTQVFLQVGGSSLKETLGIDILFEKLTPETAGWTWKTHFTHYALSPFLIALVVTYTFMSSL